MISDSVLGAFSRDLAIDLGTANTLVFAKGEGIVLNEPSVVAVKRGADGQPRVLAVGNEAREMMGKVPGTIETIRPLREGVIADLDVTEAMLRWFIRRVHGRRTFVRPRVVVCIPWGVTEVERRAVREAASSAGAREVYLISEPMAAAIGAGLPVTEPQGNMIVDIGGGTTEVAVISLGGIVTSRSARVAGDAMDDALVTWVRRTHNLLIGERTAERIKTTVGNAWPEVEHRAIEVSGRDLLTGVPKTVSVDTDGAREALADPVREIVEAIKDTLEKTPPELAADIIDKGIVLAGGGGLLEGLDTLLREETGLPVIQATDALHCVVNGTGASLDSLEFLRRVAERA